MIRVSNVTKYYGAKRALGPVSFEIASGETVGFLGLNGAGKTTALRMLACDLRPSSGSIVVDGIDAVDDPHAVKQRIGFVPSVPPVYGDMTVRAFLRFAGQLRGIARLAARIDEVLAMVQLTEVGDQLISTLSDGYRQRVGIGQAIVHNPKLLILDEPTRGLDPVQIVEMRKLIHELKQQHTVLVSSHILTEVSQTCDRLLVLGKGEILGSGSELELAARGSNRHTVVVEVRGESAAVTKALESVEGIAKVITSHEHDGVLHAELAAKADARPAVARAVVQGGWDLLRLDYAQSELESTFLRLVGGNDGQ